MSSTNGHDNDDSVLFYDDLLPPKELPEGFKKFQLKRGQHIAPKINWGTDYLGWPPERKIEYLEKLSYTMNHAADMMQQDRNRLSDLLYLKERLINQLNADKQALQQTLERNITEHNLEKNTLAEEVVAMRSELNELRKKLKNATDD